MEFVDWVALGVFGVGWFVAITSAHTPLWFLLLTALGFGHFIGRAISWYRHRRQP